MDITDSKLLEILDVVCENAHDKTRQLGELLGIDDVINKHLENPFAECDVTKGNTPRWDSPEQCWSMLVHWVEKYRNSNIQVLLTRLMLALQTIRLTRVADMVSRLMSSNEETERAFVHHIEREHTMNEVLHWVTDECPYQWRSIAAALGLTRRELAYLEVRYPLRTREKCLQALYRWRKQVVLRQFKPSSIVQAMGLCGLHTTAVKLIDYLQTGMVMDRRSKGELVVKIRCVKITNERKPATSEKKTGTREQATAGGRDDAPGQQAPVSVLETKPGTWEEKHPPNVSHVKHEELNDGKQKDEVQGTDKSDTYLISTNNDSMAQPNNMPIHGSRGTPDKPTASAGEVSVRNDVTRPKPMSSGCTESSMSIHIPEDARERKVFSEYPRPKHVTPESVFQEFVLNKVFYRLLDDLDCQRSEKDVHPLIDRLQKVHGCYLTHVNRKCSTLHIYCPDQLACKKLYAMAQGAALSKVINDCMISTAIVQEIGALDVELGAAVAEHVYDRCMKELYVPTRIVIE